MGSFDSIQRAAQDIVTRVFGASAIWIPLVGGNTYTAEVLVNYPSNKERAADQEYMVDRPRMEYLDGDLPGLFERIYAKAPETIIINGITYYPYNPERKYDGTTIIMYLEQLI